MSKYYRHSVILFNSVLFYKFFGDSNIPMLFCQEFESSYINSTVQKFFIKKFFVFPNTLEKIKLK